MQDHLYPKYVCLAYKYFVLTNQEASTVGQKENDETWRYSRMALYLFIFLNLHWFGTFKPLISVNHLAEFSSMFLFFNPVHFSCYRCVWTYRPSGGYAVLRLGDLPGHYHEPTWIPLQNDCKPHPVEMNHFSSNSELNATGVKAELHVLIVTTFIYIYIYSSG